MEKVFEVDLSCVGMYAWNSYKSAFSRHFIIVYSLIFCRKRQFWVRNNELSMSRNVDELISESWKMSSRQERSQLFENALKFEFHAYAITWQISFEDFLRTGILSISQCDNHTVSVRPSPKYCELRVSVISLQTLVQTSNHISLKGRSRVILLSVWIASRCRSHIRHPLYGKAYTV